MESESKIYVAGHRGLAGSAILRHLRAQGYTNFVLKTKAELDLRDGLAVSAMFDAERPHYVFDAAAKVGGILANRDNGAEFIYDNLLIATNLIDSAYRSGVKKLLFLASSAVYPKDAAQPLREEMLWHGPLDPTHVPYATAKLAGLSMIEAYRRQYGFHAIGLLPTNLYGPGDHFEQENAHVLAALLNRIHRAKTDNAPSVLVWGTGTPRREFLYVDDLAEACVFLMRHYDSPEPINVGTGSDVSIAELAATLADVIGYQGAVEYDADKPDGLPRKLLDVSRLRRLGWSAPTELRKGIQSTYDAYLARKFHPMP